MIRRRPILVSVLILTALAAGALLLREPAPSAPAPEASETDEAAQAPEGAPAPAAPLAAVPAPGGAAGTVAAEPPAARAANDSQAAPDLSSAFPDTEIGQSLARAAGLMPRGLSPDHPSEFALLQAELEKLRANPLSTIEALSDGLQKLPEQYSDARPFLLQFAARLDVPVEKKIELFAQELDRPAGMDQADAVATAIDELGAVGSDPTRLRPLIEQALGRQNAPALRNLILSRYELVDPAGARLLRERYPQP